MLNKKITQNQFIIFSLSSLFLFFILAFFVIQEKQRPIAYAEEIYIPHKKIETTKILIFGDMMLDRYVREKINKNGAEYPFELIKNILFNNDIVVANAEGSFTSFDSVTVGKKNAPLNFTFDPALLPILKNLGFTLLGQSNNHTLNFGIKGFSQSTTSIISVGLNYFGDPSNKNPTPYIKKINGEKIGFIAYNEFAYQGKDKIISTIKELKNQVSYLIVYPHWGEEYNLSFTSSQQKTAYEFIDAGADVIIGMHPHVIEPLEIYNGKLIFYSIGNFIFDQAQTGPKTEGLAIKILLNKNLAIFEINPFFIKNAQAILMIDENRQRVLNTLSKSVIIPENMREEIATGTIKIMR
ncbi:MAG: CapA family protein [bacterium]